MDSFFLKGGMGPWPKVCERCDAIGPDHNSCPWPCTAFIELEATMNPFEKINHITLYDMEKLLVLCEGDIIVARYEVTDNEDAFDEGLTSKWSVKEFKEASD